LLKRQGNALEIIVNQSGKMLLKKKIKNGETVLIELVNKK